MRDINQSTSSRQRRWKRFRTFAFLTFILLFLIVVSWQAQHWSSVELAEKVQDITEELAKVREEGHESAVQTMLFKTFDSFEKRSFLTEVLRHITLASLIALILLLSVEIHIANETREEEEEYRRILKEEFDEYKSEILQNVWWAIAEKQVPEEVVTELNRHVKADVVLMDASYIITLERDDYSLPEGFVVLRRDLSYDLQNLTNQEGLRHPLRTVLVNQYSDIIIQDKQGRNITMPRFTKASITDNGREEALKLEVDQRVLQQIIPLPKDRSIGVNVVVEELKRKEDKVVYGFLNPAVNFTVIVNNKIDEYTKTSVLFYHPNREAFRQRRDGTYVYTGGVLPGQSFSIEWWRGDPEVS